MKNESKHERLRGWFQLLRLPHLFTVPGDPLIGFLIAGGLLNVRGFAGIAMVCFISSAMSLFGIITNDLADIQIDMTEHPDRPLPRGVISPRTASYAAQLCFLGAVVPSLFLGWRFSFVTLVALVCIYTYNFYVKYRPKRASTMMAIMRDLMFGLGILIVHDISLRRILLLVVYGVGLFLYYCGLNEITRSETLSKMVRPGGGKMLSGACCCCLVVMSFVVFNPPTALRMTNAREPADVQAAVPSDERISEVGKTLDVQAAVPSDERISEVGKTLDVQAAVPSDERISEVGKTLDVQAAVPSDERISEVGKTADVSAAVPSDERISEVQKAADVQNDEPRKTVAGRTLAFRVLPVLLCVLYFLIALWVYQVSRTGASPARVQMAVQVSFRAALMVQAAATAACGLVILPLILLFCLVCSAIAEKYSFS